MLSDEGMSTRAIAPIVGVQQPAVVKDLAKSRQAIPLESPEPAPSTLKPEPGEIIDQPAMTTGMDGKQYYRPNQSASDTAGPRLCDNYRLRVSLISSASLT